MRAKELIGAIRKKTKTRINEVEAKALLKEYNVPVVPEAVAADAQEAVAAADAFGYPVVVKGLGAELAHKTERGLVHLNLSTAAAVKKAVEAIKTSAGDDLDGIVIQPQIQGKRELVTGLFRDLQFGPVVMLHRRHIYRSTCRCCLSSGTDQRKRCSGYANRNQSTGISGRISRRKGN